MTDRGGRLAFPWGNVDRSGDRAADHRAIAGVVQDISATMVVVGLPLSLDGREGPAAQAARAEAGELAQVLAEVMGEDRVTVGDLRRAADHGVGRGRPGPGGQAGPSPPAGGGRGGGRRPPPSLAGAAVTGPGGDGGDGGDPPTPAHGVPIYTPPPGERPKEGRADQPAPVWDDPALEAPVAGPDPDDPAPGAGPPMSRAVRRRPVRRAPTWVRTVILVGALLLVVLVGVVACTRSRPIPWGALDPGWCSRCPRASPPTAWSPSWPRTG